VVAPHADDEVLGAGGLMARASRAGAKVHVIFMAVDGLKHWGHPEVTTLEQRIAEIEAVAARIGFGYEIVYAGRDLIEQLDTVSQREMVNAFEDAYNRHEPELLLLPHGEDFDQDHRHTYRAAFAAARPIPQGLDKFFPPNVWTYEIPKIIWSDAPFKPAVYVDISETIEDKIDGLALYATQLREPPHIRSPENVRALAYLRGSEIGVEYAEAFTVLRSVLR
jgi:LmbE family N-acetylglucosaminyl deacetylase